MALVPDECSRTVDRICGKEQLFQLFYNLVAYAEVIAILVAGVAVLFGGFKIMTAAGDEGKVSEGRKAITKAVVGIAIVFSAYLIVNTILVLFTDCTGWDVFGGIEC